LYCIGSKKTAKFRKFFKFWQILSHKKSEKKIFPSQKVQEKNNSFTKSQRKKKNPSQKVRKKKIFFATFPFFSPPIVQKNHIAMPKTIFFFPSHIKQTPKNNIKKYSKIILHCIVLYCIVLYCTVEKEKQLNLTEVLENELAVLSIFSLFLI